MKRVHLSVILLFLFSTATLFSCSDKKGLLDDCDGPQINMDSLFIDLNAPLKAKRAAEADQTFSMLRKKTGLNGVVLYAEQGQIIYEKAFGWKDLTRRKDSMEIDDQFQLASVSKMFTAEAVMLLYSRGKLDYGDDVRQYIPEFPYEGITIRNLLNHRSGLSRYENLAQEHWENKKVPMKNEDLIRLLAIYKPAPYSRPDLAFNYSNINYALLASIVERVSKMHFEDFLEKNIFKPLNMNHSFVYSMRDDSILTPYFTKGVPGHDLRRKTRKSANEYLNGVMGDKIMFSTVEDLYRFSIALDYNLLLPDSIQSEAFKPGSPDSKRKNENYGFGWRLNKKHPGKIYHFGWWKGYRSFFIRDVQHNRVLIMLTNTDTGAGGEQLWKFIEDTTTMLPPAQINIKVLECQEHHAFPLSPCE